MEHAVLLVSFLTIILYLVSHHKQLFFLLATMRQHEKDKAKERGGGNLF